MEGFYNDVPDEKHMISRVTFYLWMYLASQDLFEEALEFLEEHLNRPLPFDPCFNASAKSALDDFIHYDH